MKTLTKAEEQIMQILWKKEKAFVNDLLEEFPDPKPAYNTVSTIIRILETKGFVAHETFGKSHAYYPIVTKSSYKGFSFRSLMDKYFKNSFNEVASFFVKENKDYSIQELEELKQMLEDEINERKKEE
jgi:predicted transcriptional regulator